MTNSDALRSNIIQEIYDSNNKDHTTHAHDVGLLTAVRGGGATTSGAISKASLG